MKDMGVSLVRTSAHLGARNKGEGFANHESWQGKVFYWKEIDENRLQNEANQGRLKLDDFEVPRSVSAKALNYDVVDSDGTIYHFVEGTRIQDIEVFAGKGTRTPLHEGVAEGLTQEFGGQADNWQHVKGFGVLDDNGENARAEVHWFQEESVGRVKFKLKEWLE